MIFKKNSELEREIAAELIKRTNGDISKAELYLLMAKIFTEIVDPEKLIYLEVKRQMENYNASMADEQRKIISEKHTIFLAKKKLDDERDAPNNDTLRCVEKAVRVAE